MGRAVRAVDGYLVSIVCFVVCQAMGVYIRFLSSPLAPFSRLSRSSRSRSSLVSRSLSLQWKS